MDRKLVPWWTEECHQDVRNWNRAFRQVKRPRNMQHLIQYKKAQTVEKRTVHHAKRESWKNNICGRGMGNEKKMGGDRREFGICS